MRKVVFLLTIIMSFTLAGCWDSVETEKLGVVTLFGVQLSDNNNIKVTVQEVSQKNQTIGGQPAGSQSSGSIPQSPFYVYSEEGFTISEAIQKISSQQHQKIYFGHTKVIILDEEMVRSKGIHSLIDFYERTPEMRLKTWLLISKSGQLDKILTTNTGLNADTGSILEETISNEKDNSYLTVKNLKDFIELITKSGSEAYTSGVSISHKNSADKTSDNKFAIKDTAVFKNDNMIGWLNNEESRGLSFASGNLRGGFMTIPFEDDVLSLRILKVTSKAQPVIDNGKIQINLKLDVLSNISESHTKSNFMSEDIIKKIQQLQSNKIKNEITSALDKSKSLNCDIFEFGNYFNMVHNQFWKKIKNNWEVYYPSLRVNIDVNTTIKNIGNNYKTLR